MSRCVRCARRRHAPATLELARLHEAALPHPSVAPAAFDLAVWSRPAHVIGGDALAAWSLDRDRLLVLLADVMGHDTPAALIASDVRLDLYRIRQAGVTSPAEVLQQVAPANGLELTMGIRPEGVRVAREAAEGFTPVEAHIIEPLGAYDIIDLKLGRQIFRARTPSGFVAKPGVRVWARLDAVQTHFFDARSGGSLNVRLRG